MCIGLDDSIVWSRNEIDITSTADGISVVLDTFIYGNRTYYMSFLTFCPFEQSHEGNYTCSVSEDDNDTQVTANVYLRMKSKCN